MKTLTKTGATQAVLIDHARHHTRRRHQPTRAVVRFLAGRDVDGQRRTDNQWNKPGTVALTPHGRASRWAHYSHRRRSTIRIVTATAVLLTAYGYATDVSATATTVRAATWVGILIMVWAIWETSRRYAHRRDLVAPLGEVLAQKLGDSRYIVDPRTWIQVPVDIQDRPSVIYLPATYSPSTDAQEKAFANLVARKIGLVHPTHTFELKGERPYMELRPAPAPPDDVDFAQPTTQAIVEALPEGQLFLGLGPRDEPCTLDLDVQSPHVGMSMATNAGKSTTARGLLMQHLHKGGIALVLDPKMDSQLWARGLPNVRYADTPQEIHEALLWLSSEVDRRNRIVKQNADINGNVDPGKVGPRLMVIAEELNTLESDLATYWRTIKKPGDPVRPVSLTALGRAFNMGRARRINVIPIAQELLVQSLGGPAAKANLSTRILGRANTPTWNKLAPECKVSGRYPRKSMHRGRVYVVVTDEAVPVQTMNSEVETARAYAVSGTVAAFPVPEAAQVVSAFDYGQSSVRQPHPGETGDAGQHLPHLQLVPDLDDFVTLADAAERLAVTHKTIRNARDRDPDFPEPVESAPGRPSKYRFDDIRVWADNRSSGTGGGVA